MSLQSLKPSKLKGWHGFCTVAANLPCIFPPKANRIPFPLGSTRGVLTNALSPYSSLLPGKTSQVPQTRFEDSFLLSVSHLLFIPSWDCSVVILLRSEGAQLGPPQYYWLLQWHQLFLKLADVSPCVLFQFQKWPCMRWSYMLEPSFPTVPWIPHNVTEKKKERQLLWGYKWVRTIPGRWKSAVSQGFTKCQPPNICFLSSVHNKKVNNLSESFPHL